MRNVNFLHKVQQADKITNLIYRR